jgi:hypothetical protein
MSLGIYIEIFVKYHVLFFLSGMCGVIC